jgi:ParB/RepB/Spo0J family partition protein
MSTMPYEIAVKPVAWFFILKQIREQATDTQDAQLTESIRQHGVLQPLGARHDDGRLVWGHRRLRAAIAAGLKEVPTVLLHQEMAEGEYLTLQMLENVQRADLSPYDLWQGCVRLLEANPGWQLKDLAKALSLDPSSVTRLLSPSKCIGAWQNALKSGNVGLSDIYAASKLPESDQAGLLALKLSGATRDQIEAAGRKARTAAAAPSVKVNKVKCVLPSGLQIIVSGDGVSLESSIDALTEAIREMKRAKDLGYTAKTFAAAMKDKARKAG